VSTKPQPTTPRTDEPIETPEAKTPRPRKTKVPAEPVTTLAGYFTRKTYGPARFLKDLAEANIWVFSHEDRTTALDLAKSADAKFTRTINLAAAALQAPDTRFRLPVLEFVWLSAEQRLRENPRYMAAREAQSSDPTKRLQAIGSALEPGLQDSKRRVESLNLLLAAALWLQDSTELGMQVIVDEVVSSVISIPRLRRPDDRALVAHIAEKTRSGPKAALPLVGLLEPWIDNAKQSARRASSEAERADTATEALERTDDALEQAQTEISALRKSVEEARAEATRAVEQSQAERTHHEHTMNRLRSQVSTLLTGRLTDLLTTAREALELDEPRVRVAQEKLEIAAAELEKKAEWLRSSA
jgi:hypothetical protein